LTFLLGCIFEVSFWRTVGLAAMVNQIILIFALVAKCFVLAILAFDITLLASVGYVLFEIVLRTVSNAGIVIEIIGNLAIGAICGVLAFVTFWIAVIAFH